MLGLAGAMALAAATVLAAPLPAMSSSRLKAYGVHQFNTMRLNSVLGSQFIRKQPVVLFLDDRVALAGSLL
jgi:hypothetical protein